MREIKTKKLCTHYYEYSHQESHSDGTTNGTLENKTDVLVCRKCGHVKRQNA